MKSGIIFCPKCGTLLLEAPQCTRCGWKRPTRPPGEDKRLLWERRFTEGVSSGLVWAQDSLFFVDRQGRLQALNTRSMEPAWEQPVALGAQRIYSQVAVAQELVILGTMDESPLPDADKVVLAVERRTGKERWRQPLQERQISDAAVADGRVFVATASHHGVALRQEDGKVLWRQPIQGLYKAAPATHQGLVYFGGNQGALTALHQEDGRVAWTYQVEAFGSWPLDLPYTPAAADGVLYFTCWNRKTYALDARSGEVIWISAPTKKRSPMSAPLVSSDKVYLVAHDRYVYALDRATGQEQWRTQLPRRSEVQPLLVDGMLYVAARDHHVYALDADTGERQEAPILTTGGKVSKPWTFDGEAIYVADDLGKVYAVRLVKAPEEAAEPTTLMQAGQWEDAAVAWALQGDYAQAASIYAEQLKQPQKAAQLYEKAQDFLQAAIQYEAHGDLKRALELYRQARAWDKVAELATQLQDLLTAAQAYEELEQWDKAGKFYFKLGKYAQAVALYEKAAAQARERGDTQSAQGYLDWAVKMYTDYLNQPAKAIVLLNEFDRREAAAVLLQSIPGWKDEPALIKLFRKVSTSPRERAQAYEEAGAPLLAAQEYIAANEHTKAANLLAREGEFKLAAEQYLLVEMPAKAADMMVQMQNWDEAAELYLKADRLQDALQAFLKAGDTRQAVSLYEKLGQWQQAAASWEQLGLWESAARAWEKAEDFVQAARAWKQEGEAIKAAENYEKAAQQQSLNDPNDRETMARLYELAMEQYRASGVENKAAFCDSHRRRYRKQPLLQVNAIHVGALHTEEFGTLEVVISNRGWGQAKDIRVQVATSYFELDTSRMKSVGLAAERKLKYTLWLEPRKAGQVPLHLTITYLDRKGQPMPELTYDTDVRVHRAGSKTSAPQVIQVQGDFIQAEQVQKQVGDRVEIKREGRGVSLSTDDATPPPATHTISCAYCGTEQPATNARCQNTYCNEPFIQCPGCGLYQPKDERSPEQYCMFCGGRI